MAVEGLPQRIASADEMAVAFGEANERVLALTGPDVWREPLPMFMFPMSTLCVAAWTPEGGLLIGWMGDTLPFIATAQADGFSAVSYAAGHTGYRAAASKSASACRPPTPSLGRWKSR